MFLFSPTNYSRKDSITFPLPSHVRTDKLIVSSFQGMVRIYQPCPSGFSPDHVMLEKQMELPVIQVAAGRFVQ